jgi:hypothetical protein
MSPPTTPSPSLEQSLAQLHAELARATRVDETARQLLRALLTDIERLLREGDVTAGSSAAPHRLEGLAVEFEAEHPSLAASLRQFIDLLGKTGL